MKYIFLIIVGIITIANGLNPNISYANEWDACNNKKNGDSCNYTSAPTNGPNGPTTSEISGFCDRAGGVSGAQFFCNKEPNGWKDCFQRSIPGDACELNGKLGVCKGDSGNTCDTTKKPTNTPGGSTADTCDGKTCTSGQVCVDQGGKPTCTADASVNSKCDGKTCTSGQVCVNQGGKPTCTANSAKPGNPANDGTTSDASSPQTVGFVNPIRFNSIPELIAGIINALLGILGAITVAILVMSGFKYMTASNPGEVGQALDGIRNAIVGLMIVMGAFLITQYIISALV